MQQAMDAFYQERGHRIVSRLGTKTYDLVLALHGCDTPQRIEEKFRDRVYGDILVEVIQNLNPLAFSPGWLKTSDCDYLHYVFCQNDVPVVLLRLPWPRFRSWLLQEYLPEHRVGSYCVSRRGWGLTLNITIPIRLVPQNMVQRIDVSPMAGVGVPTWQRR